MVVVMDLIMATMATAVIRRTIDIVGMLSEETSRCNTKVSDPTSDLHRHHSLGIFHRFGLSGIPLFSRICNLLSFIFITSLLLGLFRLFVIRECPLLCISQL